MQRPPLFESDCFIYWKNRFETYVKAKDLDLWHIILNGDFAPVAKNEVTQILEVVPFEQQDDDLKRKLAKNNEAKMVLYNALPKKEAKVTAIEKSKDLSSLALDELIGNLKVPEVVMEKDSEIYRGKKERVKSIALKAKKESSDDETLTSESDDEEYAMAKGNSDRKCFGCGKPNHLIGDCPKPPCKKDQRSFIGGSWRDSENEAEDKTNDETCLMAQSSNEVTLDSSHYSDNDSSLDDDKPKNVNEALGVDSWVIAMQEELNQFIANDVWDLVPLPKSHTVIGTKWVYRNKLDENARLDSIRILLAIACANDFKLYQMDVKSVFLNGFINEEVYVAQPLGFIDFEKPDYVYKLKKALYGLKQAPKACMMGELNFFLGLEIKQMEDEIFFNQSKYINEMLKKFGVEDSKPTKTPMSTEIKLTKDDEADSVDSTKYRENPKTTLEAVKHIFRTEVEYVSARKACQQALWMKQALIDYDIRLDDVPIMCDNKGAIDLSRNPVQHSRTKHTEIRHHFLRDNVQKGNISIEKVASEDNIADILLSL
ncbi:retrovirus-related pol polyprotein from transposon TNT 1-94 [Tanacetum coccineum]